MKWMRGLIPETTRNALLAPGKNTNTDQILTKVQIQIQTQLQIQIQMKYRYKYYMRWLRSLTRETARNARLAPGWWSPRRSNSCISLTFAPYLLPLVWCLVYTGVLHFGVHWCTAPLPWCSAFLSPLPHIHTLSALKSCMAAALQIWIKRLELPLQCIIRDADPKMHPKIAASLHPKRDLFHCSAAAGRADASHIKN